MDSNIRKLAQLIVKDRETGCEYMIADFGETQGSRQRLVNLSTNETRVFQYNTIEEQERAESHGPESPLAASASAGLIQPQSDAGSERKQKTAGKIWYGDANSTQPDEAPVTAPSGPCRCLHCQPHSPLPMQECTAPENSQRASVEAPQQS